MGCLPKSLYFSWFLIVCGTNKQENTVYGYHATLQDGEVSYGSMAETQLRNY
jgi:hypothetical protein